MFYQRGTWLSYKKRWLNNPIKEHELKVKVIFKLYDQSWVLKKIKIYATFTKMSIPKNVNKLKAFMTLASWCQQVFPSLPFDNRQVNRLQKQKKMSCQQTIHPWRCLCVFTRTINTHVVVQVISRNLPKQLGAKVFGQNAKRHYEGR